MRVLVVTGTRADWGLLRPVVSALTSAPDIEPVLAVTGQHLAPGNALPDAKQIDHRIDMGISDDDSAAALGIAMGRGVAGMAAVLEADRPDLMLVL
ncbi:MAG: UDP-N-acetylglucosamine 2-epimerase (hydrolyzing), partial [Pseudomonadota bacterium]